MQRLGLTCLSAVFGDTVTSLFKDTQVKGTLDVKTLQEGTHHCILTAMAPLS